MLNKEMLPAYFNALGNKNDEGIIDLFCPENNSGNTFLNALMKSINNKYS